MLNWLVAASKLHKHRVTCCTAEWPFYVFLFYGRGATSYPGFSLLGSEIFRFPRAKTLGTRLVGGVHQSRVGVDQRYKYMGRGVDHGAGHHSPCDQTGNVQRSAA